MESNTLIPQLFKSEYSKIISVLCNHFGFNRIEDAEDIVSDTFLKAAQSWGSQNIPPNPTAWLYTVAKNKATDTFRRKKTFTDKVAVHVKENTPLEETINFSNEQIMDSQLKMMFVLCDKSINVESQISMSLKVLCGFGIEEIATAFLVEKDTINKRLYRAKQKLKVAAPQFELSASSIKEGLPTVLHTIYLLFNEGYFSSTNNEKIRKDLCLEALRLALLLSADKRTNLPDVNALIALMCYHTSRMEARVNEKEELVLFQDQDTSKWNQAMVKKGDDFMNKAAVGSAASKYHFEAAIAYWHTQKDSTEKWESILQFYNRLLQIEYSPIVALNRTYALSKVKGNEIAI